MTRLTPGSGHRGVFLCLLVLVALMMTGCTVAWIDDAGDSGAATCIVALPEPASVATGVFVEPDDGYIPVLEELAGARCTIDISIYMLTDDEVFAALLDAESRGVQVRVILDEHPYGMFGDQQEARDRLEAGGVDVIWSSPIFQFSHAKYIVIDHQVALIMNQNLTGAAFNSNREFGVVTTEPGVVGQAQARFDYDWGGEPDVPVPGPLVISPETSRTRITGLINQATISLDFYAEIIRDDGILEALHGAVQRDVQVRLIVNQSLDPADLEAITSLSLIGVDIRMMPSLYIHSKVMIVDGSRALVGSQNYTMTSLDRNREVGMVIDDPVLLARINAVYERDWLRSMPAQMSGSSGWIYGRYTIGPTTIHVGTVPFPFRPAGRRVMVTP